MSVVTLLGLVTDASETTTKQCYKEVEALKNTIAFDPLIQFGCVLSALIHDIDHQGVSNTQLVKESDPLASRYNNKAVAEQHSMDVGWGIFMDKKYSEFRNAICPCEHDLRRLRQVVVNSVIATDIMDQDLKEKRNLRWNNAFVNNLPCEGANEGDAGFLNNRRATLVLEHLIQASDVSHCMQHWHIYRKWNARLFQEMHNSYAMGRGSRDPAEFWYHGELAFFDFYIIPLAKRLRDCEVFGATSDEFVNYAERNREEWRQCGEEIVSQMVHRVQRPQQ
jgi:3'5'-cyclic nucleotide phosphodiesterase